MAKKNSDLDGDGSVKGMSVLAPDGKISGFKDAPLLGRSNFSTRVVQRISFGGPHPNSGQNFGFGISSSSINQQVLQSDAFGASPEILPSRKVCFICICAPEETIDDETGDELHIYMVDLSENSSMDGSLRDPMIRISLDHFDFRAFCLLRKTIYMFMGYNGTCPHSAKRVFTCEIPSLDAANKILKENDLIETSSMHHRKYNTTAMPTPDGKMLVLSARVHFNSDENSDFEIYDPEIKIWEQFPSHCDDQGVSVCQVDSYSFINNEPVLLLRTDAGLFTVEIRPPYSNKRWKRFDRPHVGYRALPKHGSSFFVVGDVLCLANRICYDLEKVGFSNYPQLSSLSSDYRALGRLITLVDMAENGKCIFCVTEAQLNERTMESYLVFYVYSIDIMKYKYLKDIEKGKTKKFERPDIRGLKSFKFKLMPQSSDCLFPINSFTVPAEADLH